MKFLAIKSIYKTVLFFLLLIFSSAANTDDQLNNSSNVLQQKLQQCTSLIDADILQRFEARGLELSNTLQALCKNNEINLAQSQATKFAVEIQKSKDLSIFRQCGRILEQTTSTMSKVMKVYFVSDLRFTHICEQDAIMHPEGFFE